MSGERLFRRSAKLTIAAPVGGSGSLNRYGADVTEITGLRFSFEVKKNLGKEPNTAKVSVWNLSEQSRANLQGRTLRVVVSAGYEGTEASIFVGDSRHIDSALEGPDWITTIEIGDGERGYKHGRVSESWRGGVPVTRVLQKIADGMQLDSTQLTNVESLRGRQYVAGYAAHGRSSRALDKILKGYGLEWSIQDGKLQVLTPEGATTESIVVLDSTSGLIGSPTLNTPTPTQSLNPFTGKLERSSGKPTLVAKSLLQPEIKPGRRVQIDSVVGIKGVFRVTAVTHSGDTAGDQWYSDLEAVSV